MKIPTDINERAAFIHQLNIKWWQNIETGEPIERNKLELLALVVSEISECLEGERKNLMDDKLPHRKMAEVEMADTAIRLYDYAAGFGYQLSECVFIQKHTSDNKGELLFKLTYRVCRIGVSSDPEVDISLALQAIQTYCHMHGYDLQGAIEEKLEYNTTRQDHTHEARKIAGGKQF